MNNAGDDEIKAFRAKREKRATAQKKLVILYMCVSSDLFIWLCSIGISFLLQHKPSYDLYNNNIVYF